MKLNHIKIENFRAIKSFEYDFTDDFGNVRDVTLIVGPNGSGKTSILDAIWFGLMGELGYKMQRDSFRTDSQYVVRQGARYAKVIFGIEISEEERSQIEKWQAELKEHNNIDHSPLPNYTSTTVEWTYPTQHSYRDSESRGGYGGYRFKNDNDWELLKGRYYYSRIKQSTAKRISQSLRRLSGGIYFFEQERDIIARPVYQVSDTRDDDFESNANKTIDIRELLIDFGIKAKIGKFDGQDSWFEKIRLAFDYVCAPRKLIEVYVPDSDAEYEIDFADGMGSKYGFDGLSSGERSVLNFLVHYVYKRMYNSIVLIDELELHLHPTWQRRLIDSLVNFNDGNQFIITTHSPTLAQVLPTESVIELGQLDIPDWQSASTAVEDM
jgi:predicted ATPase